MTAVTEEFWMDDREASRSWRRQAREQGWLLDGYQLNTTLWSIDEYRTNNIMIRFEWNGFFSYSIALGVLLRDGDGEMERWGSNWRDHICQRQSQ